MIVLSATPQYLKLNKIFHLLQLKCMTCTFVWKKSPKPESASGITCYEILSPIITLRV